MARNLRLATFIAAVSFAGCLGSVPPGTGSVGGNGNKGSGNTGSGTTGGTMGSGTSGSGTTGSGSMGSSGTPDPGSAGATGGTAGGMGNTFDHQNDQIDPFALLQRIQQEGPPEISSRMHSCQKMKYATVGNVLAQLGVNMSGTGKSAGALFKGGAQALGAPNYAARVPEAIAVTTAGATKLFDIFVQAAPEIIKAMPTNASCMVAGAATNMFNSDGTCSSAGVSCLLGAPATKAQVDLCSNVVGTASSATIGQAVAVATILAAAHTCE
jgi:hypothetical protein